VLPLHGNYGYGYGEPSRFHPSPAVRNPRHYVMVLAVAENKSRFSEAHLVAFWQSKPCEGESLYAKGPLIAPGAAFRPCRWGEGIRQAFASFEARGNKKAPFRALS
jgi:hypothetical protein